MLGLVPGIKVASPRMPESVALDCRDKPGNDKTCEKRTTMPNNLSIRPYAAADLDVVAQIWVDSWQSTGIAAAATVTRADLRERLPQEIARGWSVFVALRGAAIVAFLALSHDRLDQLFVSPLHQNQGIGKRLLHFAKSQRPSGFHLTTDAASRAPRFYEREGLVRGGTSRHHRFGHEIVRYDWLP
jgi:GNAT superfamily N-acetyltransferase